MLRRTAALQSLADGFGVGTIDPLRYTDTLAPTTGGVFHHARIVIGLLAGPESSISARMRLSSWREALHRLGVSNAVTVFGDWSAASGWHKTFELLHHHPRISAIVVANDQMALGVLSALAQLNRTGSSAISVTGYDDTADSLYFQPPLTTVAQNFDLLGKRAVELLAQQMATPQMRIRELLPTTLIVRQSTWAYGAEPARDPLIAQLKTLVEKL